MINILAPWSIRDSLAEITGGGAQSSGVHEGRCFRWKRSNDNGPGDLPTTVYLGYSISMTFSDYRDIPQLSEKVLKLTVMELHGVVVLI